MKKKKVKVVLLRKLWKLPGQATERGIMWGQRGRFHASVERTGDGWKWTWRLGQEVRSALAPSLELCIEVIKVSVGIYEQQLKNELKALASCRRANK